MGCYPPLGKIVSKAIGKCNGRERWREERLDYAMAYPPDPPTKTHYMRPVARTVTFVAANSIYVIPPEPPTPQPQDQKSSSPEHQAPPPQHEPDHQPQQPQPEPAAPVPAPAPAPEQTQAEDDDAPPAAPKPPKGPKRGKRKQPGRVRFGPEQLPPPQQQQQQQGPGAGSGSGSGHEPGQGAHGAAPPAQGLGYLFRYTPSPLPRWEATPRRHEYFSGEYRSYYPTPVREGIYSIATDANRLTTIFSEENPNACAMV